MIWPLSSETKRLIFRQRQLIILSIRYCLAYHSLNLIEKKSSRIAESGFVKKPKNSTQFQFFPLRSICQTQHNEILRSVWKYEVKSPQASPSDYSILHVILDIWGVLALVWFLDVLDLEQTRCTNMILRGRSFFIPKALFGGDENPSGEHWKLRYFTIRRFENLPSFRNNQCSALNEEKSICFSFRGKYK